MIALVIIFTPILLGLVFGKWTENKHLQSILYREAKLSSLPWRNTGKKEKFNEFNGVMVTGSVVVGQDAFKAFLSNISFIFGGRVTPYESLMERARREAILRLKEKAKALGAKEVVYIRMETTNIQAAQNKRGAGSIEVFCFGTALLSKTAVKANPLFLN